MSRYLCTMLAILLLASPIAAQAERYELGRRLRYFEDAWEHCKDEKLRTEAATYMNTAVMSFFSFKLNEAGRALDQGYLVLTKAGERTQRTKMLSLWIKPSTRWLDLSAMQLPRIKVEHFYDLKADKLASIEFLYAWRHLSGLTVTNSFQEFGTLQLPGEREIGVLSEAGDYLFHCRWKSKGLDSDHNHFVLSLSKDRDKRLAALQAKVNEWKTPYASADEVTVALNLKVLQRLANGEILETDYPADRLLGECEAVVNAIEAKSSYYSSARPGQYWIGVRTASKGTVPLRVQTVKVESGKKVPLVLALHGAGGSENLFFDGYGNGKIAKLAADRGWMVAAPRSGFSKAGHAETIDELLKIYPEIDTKRIFTLGHSMGAGEALREASTTPGRFAAVAALGGGGSPRPAKDQVEAFKALPFYVGVGEKDFARGQAETLAKNLKKLEVSQVTFKQYAGIEHMIIVQEALPEVFRFFDEVARKPQGTKP